jgi:hypothetical protein
MKTKRIILNIMFRNKQRLQLALYARPKHPDTYHYALFIAPKINSRQTNNARNKPFSTTKFHVKNALQNIDGQILQPWRFEIILIPDLSEEQRLLICVVIGKITSDAVEQKLSQVPIYQVDDSDKAKARAFSCLTWVKAALDELRGSGAVSGLLDWETIHKSALDFVVRKKEEGRWEVQMVGDNLRVPTLDLLSGRELVP